MIYKNLSLKTNIMRWGFIAASSDLRLVVKILSIVKWFQFHFKWNLKGVFRKTFKLNCIKANNQAY